MVDRGFQLSPISHVHLPQSLAALQEDRWWWNSRKASIRLCRSIAVWLVISQSVFSSDARIISFLFNSCSSLVLWLHILLHYVCQQCRFSCSLQIGPSLMSSSGLCISILLYVVTVHWRFVTEHCMFRYESIEICEVCLVVLYKFSCIWVKPIGFSKRRQFTLSC